MRRFAVYVITHTAECLHYVGKSWNPKARWAQHLRGTSSRRSYIQRALKKHGREAFTLQVLEWFENEADAYEAEAWWIAFLRSNVAAYGYNLSAGGEGNPGHEVSQETRAKMSAVSVRRWSRPGERERNAEQTRKIHTGLKRSPATCRKISEAAKGRVPSAEHRAKISESSRGRPRPYVSALHLGVPKTAEHRAKVGAAHRGKKLSEETKAKLRAAWVRRRARGVGTDGKPQ
jgi:group I intron endonuclease